MILDDIVSRLARLGRDHHATPGVEGPHAAVAAIFREKPGAEGADLFFIRRAERERDPWSGHIAFPGGRREATDATLLATAIRETREEVGVDLAEEHLVARLPDVPAFTRTRRGQLVVTPFVFAVRHDVVTTPNHEVAEALWVPFCKLARGEGKGIYELEWDGKVLQLPCIRLDPGQHVLWGMTYRMLETMLAELVP